MRTIFINYYFEPEPANELLKRYSTLEGWVEGLSRSGSQVTVLQRFHQNEELSLNSGTYQFIKDGNAQHLSKWQIPFRLHRAAASACQASLHQGEKCVVHLQGLLFPLQAYHLRKVLPTNVPLVGQHHAEKPWRGKRSVIQRWGLYSLDGFLFSAYGLAQIWLNQKTISDPKKIFIVNEGSTWFQMQNREEARVQTGLKGDPVLLWVGRLDENKDPLTVLKGFELALSHEPGARIYMIYTTENLLPWIYQLLESSPELHKTTTLLGRRTYQEMAAYYNSANFFILGSHYEGSGYALVEALACGVTPIVTDIPSFREITANGKIGALWKPGNIDSCTEAILSAITRGADPVAARERFDTGLSFPVLGKVALEIYEQVWDRRNGGSSR